MLFIAVIVIIIVCMYVCMFILALALHFFNNISYYIQSDSGNEYQPAKWAESDSNCSSLLIETRKHKEFPVNPVILSSRPNGPGLTPETNLSKHEKQDSRTQSDSCYTLQPANWAVSGSHKTNIYFIQYSRPNGPGQTATEPIKKQ